MKLITRSAIALVFLIGLATPLLAANDVSIRVGPPSGFCFPVSLKNLTAPPVNLLLLELTIFDGKTCKRICYRDLPLAKKTLNVCQTLTFNICCGAKRPPGFIGRVRVQHSGGINEQWFY